MFFYLFHTLLSDRVSWLRVFRYPSTRLIAAAITSLVLAWVFKSLWFINRLKARQIGEVIRTDGPETHEKSWDANDGRLADYFLPRGFHVFYRGVTLRASSFG